MNHTLRGVNSLQWSLLLLLLSSFSSGFLFAIPVHAETNLFIRVNQVGFLPSETKTAIVMSTSPLTQNRFTIYDQLHNPVAQGELGTDLGPYLAFAHHFRIDFSSLESTGRYTISVETESSPPFEIGKSIYLDVIRKVLNFFRVQECGNVTNEYHNPCHLKDATSITGDSGPTREVDLTGGWHDAGDYTKYLITSAYTTYFLLLSYDQLALLKENGLNAFPGDLLREARIGTDWLFKLPYQPDRLIVQVSDHRDHDVGWRLPEKDPLLNNRPAFNGPSKATCGMYAATMALAANTFTNAGETAYGERCLKQAKAAFDIAQTDIPDFSVVADSMYYDNSANDNLALAATELFRATGDEKYLSQAILLTDKLPEVQWYSWGDLEGLAYARIGSYYPQAFVPLRKILQRFQEISNTNPFGYPLETYPWGSLGQQSAIADIAILYEQGTGSHEFAPLVENQRDFILGCNSHGISFIGNVGTEFVRNPHHQIAFLKHINLPGAVAEGYANRSLIKKYGITLATSDRFERFQTPDVVYFDDRNDYISNEPTISTNAQTLFLLTWFVQK